MTSRDKYRVIRKLDAGGMAEVFLGEAEGLQGFKKSVAIKRVLPNLVQNEKFLSMFLDEARLSLRFNHANVVQTFDIGRSGQTYFIVMEYVDGTNLKKVVENLNSSSKIIPMELAIFIVIEVCRGLAYAHDFRDNDGNLLGIVHRDVSPPNILLSKQGEVKIVDFGLAKATSQFENTDPGVVKGKFAYLSPEVAYGQPADYRSDIFACGIILFELLTGRRLFLGENDLKTIELVRQANVPSLAEMNPAIPNQLEEIVLRALSQRPEDRFQHCSELAESLAGFLFENGLKVTSFDLQRMVKSVAAEDEVKIQAAQPSLIDKLIQEELVRFASMDAEGKFSDEGQPGSRGAVPLDPFGFRDASGMGPGESAAGIPTASEAGQEREDESQISMSLAQMLEGEARLASIIPEPAQDRSNAVLIAIVISTAVLVIGALAAYFLGYIT